jgi:hypothetical protein
MSLSIKVNWNYLKMKGRKSKNYSNPWKTDLVMKSFVISEIQGFILVHVSDNINVNLPN